MNVSLPETVILDTVLRDSPVPVELLAGVPSSIDVEFMSREEIVAHLAAFDLFDASADAAASVRSLRERLQDYVQCLCDE